MYFDDIIKQVSENLYSAFFYTPSFYTKSSSYIFLNPTEIIPVYEKSDLDAALKLVDKYLKKDLQGYCLIEYEAGYLLEEKLEKFLPENKRKLMQFFFFDKENVKKIKSDKIDFGKIDVDSFNVSDFKLNTSVTKYSGSIKKIKEYIAAGDTYQVNYTVKGKFNFSGSYSDFFKNLLFNQSARYSAFINNGDSFIISVSPELFFVNDKKDIVTKPMKGTLRRSYEFKSDLLKASELERSGKNRAENIMIVDLLRNDLGKICKYESVKPQDEFSIEKYESLFQMVSTVKGKLKNKTGLGEIIKNIFPCGSVTGAPKIRTMEIIKELEEDERGIYTGAIGMMSKNSSVFNVAIRTLKIDKKNGKGEIGLGSGIVWESEAEKEYEETKLKSRFLTSPIKPFELIETMLFEDGKIFLFEEHLERLKKSAQFFLFAFNEKEIRSLVVRMILKNSGIVKGKLRLTLNKWGKVNLDLSKLEKQAGIVKVAVSQQRIKSDNTFQYFKTTNRELYNEEYQKYNSKGFFDVLFLNEKEELAEGSMTNIFIKKNNVWLTPHLPCGILPGIYREYFISTNVETEETILTLNDLLTADELLLVNSVRKEVKVNQLVSDNEIVGYV